MNTNKIYAGIIFFGLSSSLIQAGTISKEQAVQEALIWMIDHPIMKEASREVASINSYTNEDSGRSAYIVNLSPTGYLILNSDDKLPLVISYSPDSRSSINPPEDSAFYVLLDSNLSQQVSEPVTKSLSLSTEPAELMEIAASSSDLLIEPMLETVWHQAHPGNLYTPEGFIHAQEAYRGRAATGCVPTAFAQLMYFHRWPIRGLGTHSFSREAETNGVLGGDFSANFETRIDWANMLTFYDATVDYLPEQEEAIAGLMYNLGVASEIIYRNNGTGGDGGSQSAALQQYYYYEPSSTQFTQNSSLGPIQADLKAGFPANASLPAHSVVVDGLLINGDETTYHVNYGWGGEGNGWWRHDENHPRLITNGMTYEGIGGAVTNIRPRMLAFPASTNTEISTTSTDCYWILPKRRHKEVAKISLYESAQKQAPWSADIESFSVRNAQNWSLVTHAGTGKACWYAKPAEQGEKSSIVLAETFTPNANSTLDIKGWHDFSGSNKFNVLVSNTGGQTYEVVNSFTGDAWSPSWKTRSVNLSSFAGQEISIKLEFPYYDFQKSYYELYIESITLNSGTYTGYNLLAEYTDLQTVDGASIAPEHAGQNLHLTPLPALEPGTYNIGAAVTNLSGQTEAIVETMQLTVVENLWDPTADTNNDSIPDVITHLMGYTNDKKNTLPQPKPYGTGKLELAVPVDSSIDTSGLFVEYSTDMINWYNVETSTLPNGDSFTTLRKTNNFKIRWDKNIEDKLFFRVCASQ
ncbi:C10 family peptidase [Persicirhabdus sediminis]|uniref:C10 family peptidase n=1 Tax=Persicirhabdus sediminis TaxID=454144 RepID=A0A8J7SH74_9BACT|nr:C10 family peptidase [Persicirhabdus sediminis]MBK1790605.1 C10 family peptidase [Persicirhabdus sediminis]